MEDEVACFSDVDALVAAFRDDRRMGGGPDLAVGLAGEVKSFSGAMIQRNQRRLPEGGRAGRGLGYVWLCRLAVSSEGALG